MTGSLIENVRFDDWRELDLAVVIADFGVSKEKSIAKKKPLIIFGAPVRFTGHITVV